MYVASVTFYMIKFKAKDYSSSFYSWLICVLEYSAFSSTSSDTFPHCGYAPHVRAPLWGVLSAQAYFTSLGIIPALIFGVLRNESSCPTSLRLAFAVFEQRLRPRATTVQKDETSDTINPRLEKESRSTPE
jgi:hypothetical protein